MCKAIEPALAKLEHDQLVHQINVNTDENEALANHYNVMSLPLLVLVDNENNELGRLGGYRTYEQLKEFLSPFLAH